MATKSIISSRLTLNLIIGVNDTTGANIIRRSSYDLKTDADVDQVHTVGMALSSLSELPLLELTVQDTNELS